MKKVLALLLATIMLLGVFVGCSSDTDKKPANNESKTSVADTAGEDKTDEGDTASGEKVKLTALALTSALTKELSEHDYLNIMAENANAEISWEQVKSDWPDKKSAMLASGDIPDIIIGPGTINDADFVTYNGLFEPMEELINAHAPNVQKMFEEKPELKAISTQLNGTIYSLPKYQRYWPQSGNHQMINKVWLDNLNLEMPTNWDELYDVLLAFKNDDPNGNGANDEVPMDWAPNTVNVGGFTVANLMAGFGITANYMNGSGYYVDGGEVKNYFIDENYKTMMNFLNKCWSSGLINQEVFTQDYSQFQAISRGDGGDEAIVGFTYGWDAPDRFGPTLAEQYVAVPPLKPTADYTGDLSWEYAYQDINYGANMVMLSANCENKEAAMAFIDQFYDPYNSMQVLFGSVGECIQDNGDGTFKVLPPADESIDPGTWKWTNALADNGPMYIADSIELEMPEDMKAIDELQSAYDPYLDKVDKVADVFPRAFIKFPEEDSTDLNLIDTDLAGIIRANFAKWITEGGVDADWDGYVASLNTAGIEEGIAIMQRNYDAYNS